jgi:hypothetical protein
MRNAYKILIGRPEGNIPFRRPRCRQEDDIKMDYFPIGSEGLE